MQTTYNKILECIIYTRYNSLINSLEPSEIEVRSILLIISKTQFFYCFLFLPGILYLFHSFSKAFLEKSKGLIPKSPITASLQVFEGQHKLFSHAANNTASNALDRDLVHLHTPLQTSNDERRMDKITCLLTYKLKHELYKIPKRLLILCLPAVTRSLIHKLFY